MREPPVRVRLVANPFVALPIYCLTGLAAYACTQDPGALVLAAPAACCSVWTYNAQRVVSQYRAWQRAWDSLAEPIPRRPIMPRVVAGMIAVAVIGVMAMAQGGMAPGATDALIGLALLGAMGTVIAVAIWALAKRLRSGRKKRTLTDRRDCVTVVVTRPVLSVPTLEEAYRTLPAYCWKAINAGRG